MNAHRVFVFAAATAVLLSQSQLAVATEPIAAALPTPAGGLENVTPLSSLMGTIVLYPQPQKLGQIKDILLDPQTGQATFVVLDADIPGAGHEMLVMPYQALQIRFNSADTKPSIVLNDQADRLRNAPRLENDHWELLKSPQFLEQVRNFYQIQPYTVARPIEPPSVAPAASPCFVQQPSVNSASPESGFTQDQIDFFNE